MPSRGITTHGNAKPGVVNQRNILRRHAALIEGLYADNPADHSSAWIEYLKKGFDSPTQAYALPNFLTLSEADVS
jgi:hypothetical protein